MWNIAQQVFWDVQIILSNAKQYGKEVSAEWHVVMKPSRLSLRTSPEHSVFIFKACIKVIQITSF